MPATLIKKGDYPRSRNAILGNKYYLLEPSKLANYIRSEIGLATAKNRSDKTPIP